MFGRSKLLCIVVAVSVSATAMLSKAFAENVNLTHTLEEQEELSQFKADLESTGVIDELSSKTSYTIFAPTNDAIHKIIHGEQACAYSKRCKAKMAEIMRSHIVLGEMPLDDLIKQNGTVYSINHRLIHISAEQNGTFAVNGNSIVAEPQAGRDKIYEIDGVMANPQEQSDMSKFGEAQSQVGFLAELLKK